MNSKLETAVHSYLTQLTEYAAQQKMAPLTPDSFTISEGERYIKVIVLWNGNSNARSVFCFIGKETGDLYKAASWSKPAKGARGNIYSENLPLHSGAFYK